MDVCRASVSGSMAETTLKTLENNLLRVCEAHPGGLTDGQIVTLLQGDVKPANRIAVYNRLLGKGRLRLAERFEGVEPNKKRVVLYQWVSAKDAERFKGLDASDRMVYDIIQKSGHTGVTKRDMKFKTNIQNNSELKQIVDRLIAKRLIKEIKSVQGTNKRVYIISELEVSTLHTGGAWYNDEQEFDNEFIEAMYEQVLAFIKTMPYVTVEQVASYIADIKISNEELSVKDIRTLVVTMLYDDVLEECQGAGDAGEYFRCVTPTPAINHLADIPCGSCPLFHDCTPGGVISPESCVYMDNWLAACKDW